jgi:hypothetical protein
MVVNFLLTDVRHLVDIFQGVWFCNENTLRGYDWLAESTSSGKVVSVTSLAFWRQGLATLLGEQGVLAQSALDNVMTGKLTQKTGKCFLHQPSP